MLIILFLAGVSVLELILAAMVLRTSKSRQNLYFGVFVLSAILWSLGDALMLFGDTKRVVSAGSILFLSAPLFTALFVLYFTMIFPEHKPTSLLIRLGLAGPACLFAITSIIQPSLFIRTVTLIEPQNSVAVNTGAYIVYTLYFSIYLTAAILILLHRYLHTTGNIKAQVAFSLTGIAFSSIVSLVSNLNLPIFGVTKYIWMGPISTSLFTALIAVAIVRHRLFDIRLVVARALAYSLSIVLLLGGYSLASYAIIDNLANQLTGAPKVFVNLLLILVAAASYAPLKRYFDRVTNRLFYQDAYDASALYADLNRVLASSLDMQYLMTESAGIIEAALKPEFAAIGLKDGDGQRIFATHQLKFSQGDIDFARHQTPHIHHKVIVADELSDTRYEQFKKLLNDNDIAVLVRLTQNLRSEEEGLGYLVMGVKKSGNPYSSQDVRVLDTVANELIIAVQNALHFEEIQKFNITLQAQVDEATKKLRRTNERLKALDETKDDFISMASHQLRTPLTSVKGYLSMVMEGDAGKITATQRKMLTQAFTSSQRMVYLIADLLNVSRLKTGKFAIETSPVNLPEVIAEEMEQLTETVKAKEIKLTYKKPKDFPEVMLDETKTRQVIMNFVDNAIYYTPQGGKIEVQLEHTPDTIEFKVVDNGIGVPASERHHLFTKFYRAKNAQKARPDGTGLGLFMAKKVIVAEGGSIIFDSKEGKGSTFGFSFPLSKIKTEADSARQPAAS